MESENNEMKVYQKELERLVESIESTADVLSSFAQSKTFQEILKIFSDIPDDVQKTILFQKCQKLKKKNLMYEEIGWLLNEFKIDNVDDAIAMIQKNMDNSNALHNYINDIIVNDFLRNREKLIIILCHFEKLMYLTLQREKKPREKATVMLTEELIKNNHGMDNKNLYKTILLAIKNIVFANTDDFINIDRRLPFRNNILHRGIVDYSDEEINIAYETLMIFVTQIIQISGRL